MPPEAQALERKHKRAALQGVRFWQRAKRKAARTRALTLALDEAHVEQERLQAETQRLQDAFDRDWAALLDNDPGAVSRSVERSFAAVSHPLLAHGHFDASVLVIVGFPSLDIVPEREFATTPTGRPTTRKRSKSDRNDLYADAIAAFTLANARRAIAAAPAAPGAFVVTMRPLESGIGWKPIASVDFPREAIANWRADSSALLIFNHFGGQLSQKGRTREICGLSDLGDPTIDELVRALKTGGDGVRLVAAEFSDDPRVNVEIDE